MATSKQEKQSPMSLTLLKRSTLPVATRGPGAGIDSIAISDGGQFRLSTSLSKKVGGAKTFASGWVDKAKRIYSVCVSEDTVKKMLPKGEDPKDYMGVLSYGKDGTSPGYFAGAGILRADVPDYDFTNSGNQVFPATFDEKAGVITFTMPSGKLTPKPSTGAGRPKGSKNKTNGAVGIATTPGAASGVPVAANGASVAGDGISLEEAE